MSISRANQRVQLVHHGQHHHSTNNSHHSNATISHNLL